MRYKIKISVLLLALNLILTNTVLVQAENTGGTTSYIYDYTGELTTKSIPAFELTRVIDSKAANGIPFTEIVDVASSKDRIFIVDVKESRINVFNQDFEFVTSLKAIRTKEGKMALNPDGSQITLTNPEGAFYHEQKKELYIADTGAERIIVLDGEEYFLKRIITRPDNMIGNTLFRPSKIVLDDADKIYFIVQSAYEGIVELSDDGRFSRYFGLNKPTYNAWDFFWKSLASDTQKEGMAKTFAPSFNNIDIDPRGFVYATTTDSAAEEKVFRLDFKGGNAQQKGGWDHMIEGDIVGNNPLSPSLLIDIAVNDYGVFAVIDASMGRIFIYNYDGEMLNIFGAAGNMKGDFRSPSSITWFGDKLIATDKMLKCVYVFEMTRFGESVMGAAKAYHDGDWESLAQLSKEALRLNANYNQAYIDIGRYYLMEGDNDNAMYYFKLGQTRKDDTYGRAFVGTRNDWVSNNFMFILAGILLLAALLIFSEVRYHKRKVPS